LGGDRIDGVDLEQLHVNKVVSVLSKAERIPATKEGRHLEG
jgi:hypothetical protein